MYSEPSQRYCFVIFVPLSVPFLFNVEPHRRKDRKGFKINISVNIFSLSIIILDSGRSHDGFFIGVDGFADAARPSPDVRGEVAKDEGT